MRQKTDQKIDEIIAYYNFQPLSQYPAEQRTAMAEKMATILCKDVNKHFNYDHLFLDERHIIPFDAQEDYEAYMALIEGRGICVNAAYALSKVIEKLEIPHACISLKRRKAAHAVLLVNGRIYDPTSGLVGLGATDYARQTDTGNDPLIIDPDDSGTRLRKFTGTDFYDAKKNDYQAARDVYYGTDYGSLSAKQIEDYLNSVEMRP